MIKCVIFDVQGVVASVYDDIEFFQHLSKEGGRPPEYYMTPVFVKLWKDAESGKITTEEFVKTVSDLSGLTPEQIDWVGFYRDRLRLNEDVVKLVKQLRRDYRVVAFTNSDPGRYRATLEVMNPTMFEKIYTSFSIGARKDDPEAFRIVLKDLGTRPEEVVYIDDRKENLDTAGKLGIRTILFTNAAALTESLSVIGVKIKEKQR